MEALPEAHTLLPSSYTKRAVAKGLPQVGRYYSYVLIKAS